MHRQSLGSPASKLQSHGVVFSGTGINNNDNSNNFASENHRKDILASCSTGATDDEERKSQKPNQQKSVLESSSSSRLIHLIPILTFFCFLILYLSSHDPTTEDSAQLSGFATNSSKKTAIDSIDVDDNVGDGAMEIEENDVLAIRSMSSLQERERRRLSHLHRKYRQ